VTVNPARAGVATLAALALTLGACGDQDRDERSDPGTGAPASPSGGRSETTHVNPTPTDDGSDMQIHLTLGDHRFAATLDDSTAADDSTASTGRDRGSRPVPCARSVPRRRGPA